jgi:hypothetical protein
MHFWWAIVSFGKVENFESADFTGRAHIDQNHDVPAALQAAKKDPRP